MPGTYADDTKYLMDLNHNEQWYAVRTRSNYEYKVRDCLYLKSFNVFLPTITRLSSRRDRRKIISTPLFPGYLFVRINLTPNSQLEVLKSLGVVCLVGNKDRPLPVENQEIYNLLLVHNTKVNCAPHQYLNNGDRVIITDGPLQGLIGIYKSNSLKPNYIVISVEMFKRSLSIEIDNYSYEKI